MVVMVGLGGGKATEYEIQGQAPAVTVLKESGQSIYTRN